jgi:hypothetical protein
MNAQEPEGYNLIRSAVDMVVSELRRHPEGLRNVDVGIATGLNLPVANHPGYITWTILRYLIEQKRVEKHGRVYQLVLRVATDAAQHSARR